MPVWCSLTSLGRTDLMILQLLPRILLLNFDNLSCQLFKCGEYSCYLLLHPGCFNPLTPISDQDRISPYNINTMASRQLMRIKKKILIWDQLIQYQILQTNIKRTILQTVRRITHEILGVEKNDLTSAYNESTSNIFSRNIVFNIFKFLMQLFNNAICQSFH